MVYQKNKQTNNNIALCSMGLLQSMVERFKKKQPKKPPKKESWGRGVAVVSQAGLGGSKSIQSM